MDTAATYEKRGGDHLNQERLKKIFELTTEELFTLDGANSGNGTNGPDAEAIKNLNDELWNAGYMTWIVEKDSKPCLSVRPRRND